MNRNGFAPIFIIVIVAIAAAFSGWYFLEKNQEAGIKKQAATELQATTTAVDADISPSTHSTSSGQSAVPADWQTYRNEKYGFEFKYPPDLPLSQPEPDYLLFKKSSTLPGPYFSIEVILNPENKNIFDFYNGEDYPDLLDDSGGQFATGTANGVTYFIFNPVRTLAGGLVIIIPRYGYFLELVDSGAPASTPSGAVAQIISTFKFIQ